MPSPPRYSTFAGTVVSGTPTAFQTSTALVRDEWTGKNRTAAIGDDLGDGTLVNDIRQGRFGTEVEVVHPDGRIFVLGAAKRPEMAPSVRFMPVDGQKSPTMDRAIDVMFASSAFNNLLRDLDVQEK